MDLRKQLSESVGFVSHNQSAQIGIVAANPCARINRNITIPEDLPDGIRQSGCSRRIVTVGDADSASVKTGFRHGVQKQFSGAVCAAAFSDHLNGSFWASRSDKLQTDHAGDFGDRGTDATSPAVIGQGFQ